MRKMCRKIAKKIIAGKNNTSGETVAETLVTMIMLSLAVLMLAGAVVSAARVTSKADNTETAFTVSKDSGSPGNIIITGNQAATNLATLDVTVYKTENNYTYYEPIS